MRAVEALRRASSRLREGAVSRPRWTAEQLLSTHRRCVPIALYLENPALLAEEELLFKKDVAAAAQGMPLQYLLQAASFYGRDFEVGPGVFIPRPETEVLVDTALQILSQSLSHSVTGSPLVVDVGTGSGAIAITLRLERPAGRFVGVDRSLQALSMARRNASRYKAQIQWIQGDLAGCLVCEGVDLLIANLPYLDPEQAHHWPAQLHWEPRMALDGGRDGMELMRALLKDAARVAKPGGWLALEMGANQRMLLKRSVPREDFSLEQVVPDLNGLDRVAVLRRKTNR